MMISVVVLRHDEEGRPIIRCPSLGHDEELTPDERGEYQCPETRALTEYLARTVSTAFAFDRSIFARPAVTEGIEPVE